MLVSDAQKVDDDVIKPHNSARWTVSLEGLEITGLV